MDGIIASIWEHFQYTAPVGSPAPRNKSAWLTWRLGGTDALA